jgi:succinyl-CoA synthetase alpha subunit
MADDGSAAAAALSAAREAVTLDGILGVNGGTVVSLGASSAGASAGHAFAYAAGNVGVVYDSGTRRQTLLRGHVRRARGDGVGGHMGAWRRRSRLGASRLPCRRPVYCLG